MKSFWWETNQYWRSLCRSPGLIKRPSSHSSWHSSIHAQINLHSSADPSIIFYLFILITFSLSILSAIHPFVRAHLTRHTHVFRFSHQSIHSSIHPSIHPFIHPSTHPSFCPSTLVLKPLLVRWHPHELGSVILDSPQHSVVQILLRGAFNNGCKNTKNTVNVSSICAFVLLWICATWVFIYSHFLEF